MMIDMRGFPDTEPFVCKGAGFQRNETDCTQFFRYLIIISFFFFNKNPFCHFV